MRASSTAPEARISPCWVSVRSLHCLVDAMIHSNAEGPGEIVALTPGSSIKAVDAPAPVRDELEFWASDQTADDQTWTVCQTSAHLINPQ